MRKSRILSLLLAVAVMATMLIAVPLTASAASVSEATTWNMSDWSTLTIPTTANEPLTKDNLTFYGQADASFASGGATTFDTESISGYIATGNSASAFKNDTLAGVFEFTPGVDGTLKAYVRPGGTGARRVIITQKTPSATDGDTTGALYNEEYSGTTSGHIAQANVTAGSPVYIFGTSKFRLYRLTFTPGGSSVDPGPGGGGSGQTGEVTFAAHATPFPSENEDYIDWTFHKEAAIDVANLDTYKTSSESVSSFSGSVTISFDDKSSKEITSLTDAFDLPHGKHDSHEGSGYVLMSAKNTNLKLDNILPEDCGFDSYDLILVYNRNADNGNTTTFTLGDGDQLNKTFKDETKDNGRTTDPDELIFGNLNSNSITLSYDYAVDIYSISIDYHKSTPEVFDTTIGTESGYYTEGDVEQAADDSAKGVIRFFQSFTGNTAVKEYGFYFVNSESEITSSFKASKQDEVNIESIPGMYGDLIDIPYAQFGDTYYAVPFVDVDGKVISGKPISGSVGQDAKQVKKPSAE